MRTLLLILNVLLAVATLGSYLSPMIHPSHSVIIPSLGLLMPYFVVANILFVCFWLFKHWLYVWISALVLLFGIRPISRIYSTGNQSIISNQAYQVVSLNFKAGQHLRKTSTTFKKERMASLQAWKQSIKDIDVFLVQENRYLGGTILDTLLGNVYKKIGDREIGTSIYSKRPIKDGGMLKVGGNTRYATWADIQLDSSIVRFISVHGSSNLVSKKSKKLIENKHTEAKKLWREIKGLFANYAKYAAQRNDQYDVLEIMVNDSPYPVVIGGDFNDTSQSYLYGRLSKRFCDTHLVAGSGFGSTFKGSLPGLRIDYIMTDNDIQILSSAVDKVNISDHYPIRASFRFKPE